jgi:hypothetical protein
VADSKGQLLLYLNGVYITVLSSLTIASSQNPAKLHTSTATCDLVPLDQSRGGDCHFDPDGDRLPLFAAVRCETR